MERERKPGEGSIDKLPSGRFRLRMTRGDRERFSKTYDTLAEAERVRDAAVATLAERDLAPVGPVTLLAFGAKFLDAREVDGVRSITTERSTWRQHIATAPFAKGPVAAITRKAVEAWVEALKRKRARAPAAWQKTAVAEPGFTTRFLSRQTRTHALNLLRLCLDAAVKAEHVRANPAAGVRLETDREARTEDTWTFLTAAEIARVLGGEKVTADERDVMQFAIHAGLRTGELFGLHWEDVRLDGPRPEITVRYSWSGPTKGGRPRVVPLLPMARDALLRWRSRKHPRNGTPRGLVFPTSTGLARRRGDDGGWGDRTKDKGAPKEPGIKSRAGITRRVTFYSATRHTCASHLLMGTWGPAWTLAEVGAFLGHSDAEVTQRYARVVPAHLHSKASEMARRDLRPKAVEGHAAVPSLTEKANDLAAERVTRFELATFSLGS